MIGTLHGDGDGTTTFNIPDMRDRVAQGASTTNPVGTVKEAGLPNITGQYYPLSYNAIATDNKGCFTTQAGTRLVRFQENTSGNIWDHKQATLFFDAASGETKLDGTLQNDVYGKSDTVQMNATCFNYIIKY